MRPLQKCLVAALVCLTVGAGPSKTRNIILVTADGLRWQDLFGGLDPLLKDEKSAGMDKAAELMGMDYREYAGVEGKPIALAGAASGRPGGGK
ncbi:MAG: hypothetical protein JWO48_651 [Bryobacterales bacterium]|nr:hypothetical protein [Bryobacterales bacterium]